MGGLPSRMYGHFFTRLKQRYNIESRTQKLLDQEKLPPPPRYQADQEALSKVRLEFPHAEEDIKSKNQFLETNLKKVFVNSFDPPGSDPDSNRKINVRPDVVLPLKNVQQTQWAAFNFNPNRVVPKGKIKMEDLNVLMASFHKGSTDTPVADLSSKYNLDPSDVQKLLDYHSIFAIHEIKTNEENEDDDPYTPKENWVVGNYKDSKKNQTVTLAPENKNEQKLLPEQKKT